MAVFKDECEFMLPHWGQTFNCDNKKSREILKIDYIPAKEALIEMANNCIRLGEVDTK